MEEKQKRKIWQQPWKYKEGFIVGLGLVLIGFLLEIATNGRGVKLMSWPVNGIIGVVFVNILIGLHLFFKSNPIIKWLSTIPAAITASCMLTILVLLLGLTPQDEASAPQIIRKIGLSHLTTSWTFALIMLYFMTSLGFVTLRRSAKLTRKNMGFLLNHLGLWITLFAGIMGSGDLKRISMELSEGGHFSNTALGSNNQIFKINLSLKLIDFQMEEYPPKLAFVDTIEGKVISERGSNLLAAQKGVKETINGYQIEILDYIESAIQDSTGEFSPKKFYGAPIAIKVKVSGAKLAEKTGWISCGSFMFPPIPMTLNSKLALVLLEPEAKKFSSTMEYMTKDGKHDTMLIEVNKPVKIGGWKIYQSSYDSEKGKFSEISIIELVNDPWLPLVYFGIFMMMAGAIYLFWIGRSKPITENKEL